MKRGARRRRARPDQETRREALWAAGIFAALAVLYWHGHSRSFGPGDSAQHVMSAVVWGVSRPPGYPLYTAAAHLFSRLPFSAPAANVNAFSGLLHAAAAPLFFLLRRPWGCGRPAALVAVGLMSLSPLYWFYSEVAEVRALNDLLAIGAACAAAAWARSGRSWAWLALGACVGLGVSHHPTFPLVLPALGVVLWRRRPGPGGWTGLAALAAACAVLPYLILALRLKLGAPPAYNPDGVSGGSDLLSLFLRVRTGGLLGMAAGAIPLGGAPFDWGILGRALGWFWGLAWSDLTPAGLVLAALGAARLWRIDRRVLLFWGAWLFCAGLIFAAASSQQMRVGDADYVRAVTLRFYLLPMISLFALA